jgi:hypothetical protein
MPSPFRFVLLVYRMPATPTAGRVWVWRQLKKAGAIYLQMSVCAFPNNAASRKDLATILQKVDESGGEYHLLPLRKLNQKELDKLVRLFQEQTANHYNEIIENCEVNFTKEIEFEIFRKNFTYEEAEEIRVEFDKIREWYERVRQRDWFGAPNREEALQWIRRCEKMLEDFERTVFEVEGAARDSTGRRPSPRRRRGRPRVVKEDRTLLLRASRSN